MKNKQYSWKKKTLEAHGDKKANGKIIIKKKLKRRRTYPPLLILPQLKLDKWKSGNENRFYLYPYYLSVEGVIRAVNRGSGFSFTA